MNRMWTFNEPTLVAFLDELVAGMDVNDEVERRTAEFAKNIILQGLNSEVALKHKMIVMNQYERNRAKAEAAEQQEADSE
ncbi:MAG: hypothetical protein GKR93_12115 [Gammaproteobacteria bacterium]|nr:hypothetical protein [Gammaproteobacteria bacterium]